MKKATQIAILKADYVASRLSGAFEVLYKGRNGRVAHEWIIDIRPWLAGEWPHGYSREQAAYPVSGLYQNKFWSPASRVDNVFGDRNLVCACPSPEAWVSEPGESGMA